METTKFFVIKIKSCMGKLVLILEQKWIKVEGPVDVEGGNFNLRNDLSLLY